MYFLGDQQVMLDAILRFLDRRVTGGALRRAARKAERKAPTPSAGRACPERSSTSPSSPPPA